jgi:hypothetical protein
MRHIFLILMVFYLIPKLEGKVVKFVGDKYRDPFKSYLPEMEIPKAAPFQLNKLNVTGIIWGTDLPLAIINGKVYKVGDEILGAKILGIDKRGVLLDYKGETYLLRPK